MADKNFVGNGWAFQYGVNISVNLEKLNTLPVDKWGNVKLSVVQLKNQNEKTKATHYVAEDTYKKQDDSPRPQSSQEEDLAF